MAHLSDSVNKAASRQTLPAGKRKRPNKNKIVSQMTGYIASPALDFWLTGGISVVVMGLLLVVYASSEPSAANITAVISQAIVLQAVINWPHFMGAYALLYRPLQNVKTYPFSTLFVPVALLVYLVIALITGPVSGAGWGVNQDLAYVLWLVAAFYLAWHYTGQAWGMMATFSRLSGLILSTGQRLLLRSGLRLLLIWHVVWGAQDLPVAWLGAMRSYLPLLLQCLTIVCVLSFLIGLVIWCKIRSQLGHWPDRRVLIAWLAIYLWYWVLLLMPAAYVLVQLSHALQYLAFPLRMQVNQAAIAANVPHLPAKQRSSLLGATIGYYCTLVFAGMLIFYLPVILFPSQQPYGLAVVLASIVSIHHYFVDGCIWKISHPDVRRNLFWHLPVQKVN
ncbi:hypothetical protein [Methylophilus aquaticus]|uniref:Beta-carotene 15,15'-monooxygenase n=1 Tax=Methylophilus aquaticus TaxID=1971610 RepID=A0ABT9JT04_9PROT|nr:hypothetical protein [Methylophilus aquaticus]MDP8567680.1 hypothetical protein [Methylophilus aquaticus]